MAKTNMGKRILSGFLAVLMLVAMVPIQVLRQLSSTIQTATKPPSR